MQKHELHEGREYGYRENVRAWERSEDRPLRVALVRYLPRGKVRVRAEDGPHAGEEFETRSQNLVAPWDDAAITSMLAGEEHERRFRRETTLDRSLSGAVELVFGLVNPHSYVGDDRAYLDRNQLRALSTAAGMADADACSLSPVAYTENVDGEKQIVLPLPVAVTIAQRIATRRPEEVAQAVDAAFCDAEREGYRDIVGTWFKPRWDHALAWAGKAPFRVPPMEPDPRKAFDQLFDVLRGQGVQTYDRERHAWYVRPEQFPTISSLLHAVSRREGRVTLQPMSDGNFRLALDYVRDPSLEWCDERQVENLALWGLSDPQRRLLGAARAAGRAGVDPQGFHAKTVESLIDQGLVYETEARTETAAQPFKQGRLCLTDLGWRVLGHLKVRSSA